MKNSKPSSRSSWDKLRTDPVLFAELLLDLHLYPYQAKLLRDPSKRIVVRMCRQSGKTTILAVRALWFAVTHPNTTTLLVAPSLRQSSILMDRIQQLLHQLPTPALRLIARKLQRTQLFLTNNSAIYALPCSVHLLRGFTAHQVLADEAAFFKDDQTIFYNVLYPMLATTNGTLIASSTPWSQDSVFYRMNHSAHYSKHVTTWRDVTREGLIPNAFIQEQRRQLPALRFQTEYEAEFAEDEDAYFPQELIKRCTNWELTYWQDPVLTYQSW